MQQLHHKSVWIFLFNYLKILLPFIFLIFVFIVLSYIVAAPSDAEDSEILVSVFKFIQEDTNIKIFVLILIFIILMFLLYIIAKLAYRNYRYELQKEAWRAERGIISKKYISIPYSKIQNVDIYRGLIHRILGLSDVHIQTAGYSTGHNAAGGRFITSEGKLPGLDKIIAEKVRDELIARVKKATK